MNDRAKFEAWAQSKGIGTERDEFGRYIDAQKFWAGWQAAWTASRADALEYAAKLCDRRVMGDNNREDAEAKRCADAIRAAIGEMT